MLKQIKKLNENLEKNWTLVHKIIFTLSVFILYRAFIRIFDFQSMQAFNLLFVYAGSLVYTIDKLLPVAIIFFESFGKSENNFSKKTKTQVILAIFFMIASSGFVFLFYLTHKFPWASISIYSWCMAVYIVEFYNKFENQSIEIAVKLAIVLISILGIISIVHCFTYNVLLNIYLFIFIVLFFVYDLISVSWKKSI